MKRMSIIAGGNGTSDLIAHKKTGLVFKNNDLSDCIKQIKCAVESRELRTRLGVAAHNFVKKKFDTEKNIQQYVDLYKNMGVFA